MGVLDTSAEKVTTVATLIGGGLQINFENITGISENTSVCKDENMPLVYPYISALDTYGIILFTIGAIVLSVIVILYLDTLKYVMKHGSSSVKTHTAFIVSVYPVCGVASYCTIVVPRAHFLAEAVSQGMFMFTLYQLFCLYVDYCGGEDELIRQVKHDSLNPKVPPCCCWPCCPLPPWLVNKRNVKTLKMLVLQLPVVHALLYIVLLVMWTEEQRLYHVGYTYMQPVMITSMLLGVWALFITIKMIQDTLTGYALAAKFINLKLVLILFHTQAQLAKVLVWSNALPCDPPIITPSVYAHLIYNSAVLLEMMVLGYWARSLYKMTLPETKSKVSEAQEVNLIRNEVSLFTTEEE